MVKSVIAQEDPVLLVPIPVTFLPFNFFGITTSVIVGNEYELPAKHLYPVIVAVVPLVPPGSVHSKQSLVVYSLSLATVVT